jgi:hypothetical protein
MPAHRVLASLGDLPELEVENLKLAIAASRKGQSLVLPSRREAPLMKVKRNLAYLDVAVCLRTWNEWELTELIDELAPSGKCEVSAGEVVGALTIQRCVAPASKLEASRWYATTALPELQGIGPSQFNNTRIHRVLETLDSIEASLQQHLSRRIDCKVGQFVCLFLDCTDTWFVGRGPDLAHMRTTKEGMCRRKIGIALMCDQRGLPLRWATVAGNHHEADTMLDMIDEVAGLPWAEKLPIVVDRAMGHGVTIDALLARDMRFVTAIPTPEIRSYSTRIPLGRFEGIDLDFAEDKREQVLESLSDKAVKLGFARVGERFVLDLGVIAKGEGGKQATARWVTPSRAVAALQTASFIQKQREAGMSPGELAERHDIHQGSLRRYLSLLHLDVQLQQRIMQGQADRLTPDHLRPIARLPVAKQAAAFNRACKAAGDGPAIVANRKLARFCSRSTVDLRAVVIFDPQRFLEQRQAAMAIARDLEQLVDEINRSLRSPRRRFTSDAALGKLGHALRKHSLTDIFRGAITQVTCEDRTVAQLRLERDDRAWQRHRDTDGLFLIVSHPDVLESAENIVRLYFAKDQVEKDFKAIKSVLALRPVNHQTDNKVRAHVSLCMLALLIERAIENRLRESELKMTAATALHLLRTAQLNMYATPTPLYSATEPDLDQRRILAALSLEELADDTLLLRTLTPR